MKQGSREYWEAYNRREEEKVRREKAAKFHKEQYMRIRSGFKSGDQAAANIKKANFARPILRFFGSTSRLVPFRRRSLLE